MEKKKLTQKQTRLQASDKSTLRQPGSGLSRVASAPEPCALELALNIYWSLIDPAPNANWVVMLDRLKLIAWRILERPATKYIFTFDGREPANHPYFRELIQYLLQTPRDVVMSVETTGGASMETYRFLAARRDRVTVRLVLDAKEVAFARAALQIAKLAESGCRLQISAIGANTGYCSGLEKLRQIFGFALTEVADNSRAADKDAIRFLNENKGNGAGGDFPWCVIGVNQLWIDAEGRYKRSKCDLSWPPLWRPGRNVDPVKIIHCQNLACNKDSFIRFSTRREAETWLANYRQQQKRLRASLAYLPDPFATKLPVLQIIWSKCRNILNKSDELDIMPVYERIFSDESTELAKAYVALADECSRQIYIEALIYRGSYSDSSPCQSPDTNEIDLERLFNEARSQFTAPGNYCSLIDIKTGISKKGLFKYKDTIRRHKPLLRITGRSADLPGLLAFIVEVEPSYKLYLRPGAAGAISVGAIPPATPGCLIPELAANEQVEYSAVVAVYDHGRNLARCLDSLLAQGVRDLEIIVVADASFVDVWRQVDSYAEQYPGIVHSVRLNEAAGVAAMYNLGMERSHGSYVTFLRESDMLSHDFLAHVSAVIGQSRPDIVAAEQIVKIPGGNREAKYGVKPGRYKGEQGLRSYLAESVGSYAIAGRAYNRHFLRAYDLRFAHDSVFPEVLFNVQAFFFAGDALAIQEIGCYLKCFDDMLPTSSFSPLNFGNFVRHFIEFFEDNGLSLDDANVEHCLAWVWANSRELLAAGFLEAERAGNLNTFWPESNLANVLRYRHVGDSLIRDYALLTPRLVSQHAQSRVDEPEWRTAAISVPNSYDHDTYGDADEVFGASPLFSVIMPNYNKMSYLERCIDSILTQDNGDFELIIVDDSSTDASWNTLTDYANVYPQIRLYRMRQNVRQGICRNVGLQKARGKYIIFVDSDDMLVPGVLEQSSREMRNLNLDVLFLSAQYIDSGGKVVHSQILPDRLLVPDQAVPMLLNGTIGTAPWAKVFRRSFITAAGCQFAPFIYHQDNFFVLDAVANARRIASSSTLGYLSELTENSSLRPKARRYLHIHSVCKTLKYVEEIGTRHGLSPTDLAYFASWHYDNILMPSIKAFLDATGKVAITESDYEVFNERGAALGLFLGYAKAMQKAGRSSATWNPMRHLLPYAPKQEDRPLCSVIVAVYNQEANIARCLESILEQSLRSFEIVIVNDASTDHTLEICERFAESDARIKIFSLPANTGGCGAPRSYGIQMAAGAFITFVDSDDHVSRDFLLHGCASLIRHPDADIYQAATLLKDGNWRKILCSYDSFREFPGLEFFIAYMQGKHVYWNAQAKLYRTDFIRESKCYMPDYLFEDNVFLEGFK